MGVAETIRWGGRRFALLALVLVALAVGAAESAFAGPERARHQELLFGDGSGGPFTLTWSAVVPGTEVVSVDGRRLLLVLDYEIDGGAGKIQFRAPLATGQVAQVAYQYQVGRARQNRTTLQLPLSLTVLESRRSNLRVIGAFRQSGGAGAPAVFGFGADTRAAGAQINSLFLVGAAPGTAAGSTPDRPGNLMATSALRLAAEDGAGALKYRANWTQAGQSFVGAPQLQTAAGLRQVELAASLQPVKQLSVTAESRRTDALSAAQKAREQAAEAFRLSYRPSERTGLTLSQESTRKRRDNLVEQETRQSRLQIDQRFGQSTQFGAVLEQLSARSGATGDRRERAALSIRSRPWERLSLTTRAEQTDSERDGAARVYDVGAEVKATSLLSFGAGWTHTDSEKAGARLDRSLSLAFRGPLAVAAGLQSSETEGGGTTLGSFWSVKAGTRRSITLEGKSTDRSPRQGQEQGEESYRLEAQPHPGVKLAAKAVTRVVGDHSTSADREASVELTPAKALSLGGSLRTSTQGETTARTTSVSGKLSVSVVEVDGQFRQRERDGAEDLLTHDYTVTLRPARWLRVNGRYAENPEDKDGRVQDQVARMLGVETRVGSVTLGGNVSLTEGRVTSYEKQQREYRLALDLSRRTRIHGAYAESDERQLALLTGRTYSFGFTRAVGGDFYLQLEGTLTQYAQDGLRLSERDDTRANLRLGLRF